MNPWIEGIDYYVNEDELVVLTEKYLRERGYCCGNGCKHCPYEYEKVPESKRSELTGKIYKKGSNNPNH